MNLNFKEEINSTNFEHILSDKIYDNSTSCMLFVDNSNSKEEQEECEKECKEECSKKKTKTKTKTDKKPKKECSKGKSKIKTDKKPKPQRMKSKMKTKSSDVKETKQAIKTCTANKEGAAVSKMKIAVPLLGKKKDKGGGGVAASINWATIQSKLPVWQNMIADILQKIQDMIFKTKNK